jgi:hypothetical protein
MRCRTSHGRTKKFGRFSTAEIEAWVKRQFSRSTTE